MPASYPGSLVINSVQSSGLARRAGILGEVLAFVIADSMDNIDEYFQEEPPGCTFYIGIFRRGMYK